MRLNLIDLFCAVSTALDSVEIELLGMDTGHGRRVASLSLLMGKGAGFADEELSDFVGCCILHDNALTEFIHEELERSEEFAEVVRNFVKTDAHAEPGEFMTINSRHSVIGETNIRFIPFKTDVSGIILYHHENADGTGNMGKTSAETPLKSQILRLADEVDMTSRLTKITEDDFQKIRARVQSLSGKLFSKEAAELFSEYVTFEKIREIQQTSAKQFLRENLPEIPHDYTETEVRGIAELFAQIVDYKSEFTERHSMGVARIAERMARRFNFDDEKRLRFYFAGAFHDIGKLTVPNTILEKNGRLTGEEFEQMKQHVVATREILSEIKDIPDIIEWASNHHEKLNGTGYPQGLDESRLGFEERLMACVDIYQALIEPRPYKEGMPRSRALSIMHEMADKGDLDKFIVSEFEKEFLAVS